MEGLQKYYLELLAVMSLLIIGCAPAPTWYKKSFSERESTQLAKQLRAGLGAYYYQGTPQELFMIEEGLRHAKEKGADLWRELGAPTVKRGMGHDFYNAYGKAVALDAVEWQGWRGYLYLYFYRNYKLALADFNATDTLTPNFVDYPQSTSVDFMRAICYLQLGDYDQAISFMERHIKEATLRVEEEYLDTRVFLFRGMAFYKQGALEKAAKSFLRGLRNADDQNADLWYWLSKVRAEQTEYKLALDALENATYQYNEGYFNSRSYVEDFYQVYPEMILALKAELLEKI